MTYRVEVSDSAAADAEEAYRWIAERAPQAAARWFDELSRHIESLSSLPRRCALAPESVAFDQEVRQLLFASYRLLFTIRGRVVYVLHVRHAARLPLPPGEAPGAPPTPGRQR